MVPSHRPPMRIDSNPPKPTMRRHRPIRNVATWNQKGSTWNQNGSIDHQWAPSDSSNAPEANRNADGHRTRGRVRPSIPHPVPPCAGVPNLRHARTPLGWRPFQAPSEGARSNARFPQKPSLELLGVQKASDSGVAAGGTRRPASESLPPCKRLGQNLQGWQSCEYSAIVLDPKASKGTCSNLHQSCFLHSNCKSAPPYNSSAHRKTIGPWRCLKTKDHTPALPMFLSKARSMDQGR